jgi:hypothetical protein
LYFILQLSSFDVLTFFFHLRALLIACLRVLTQIVLYRLRLSPIKLHSLKVKTKLIRIHIHIKFVCPRIPKMGYTSQRKQNFEMTHSIYYKLKDRWAKVNSKSSTNLWSKFLRFSVYSKLSSPVVIFFSENARECFTKKIN